MVYDDCQWYKRCESQIIHNKNYIRWVGDNTKQASALLSLQNLQNVKNKKSKKPIVKTIKTVCQ